jgi:adenylate cyclase
LRAATPLKFLGDGILAIFPVEASRTDACRAALEAVAEARERLAGAAAADGTPLAFIATLHVGQVVYGNIGSPDRLDFTVLGPAVNLVSRLVRGSGQGAGPAASVLRRLRPRRAACLAWPLCPEGRHRARGGIRARCSGRRPW